ncbi:MAG: hypothetical protein KDA81_04700 [Planctomycetaceae bacterium]|nr:hypothetical protein [Planctomycetaceae bacterium]
MNCIRLLLTFAFVAGQSFVNVARGDVPENLRPENLVAWCIVPFDSEQRSPQARAEMLNRLGLRRCAYDWRQQHVDEFEEEILQYRKHQIEFFAFWSEHPTAFELFQKHRITPQIWRMLGDIKGDTFDQKVETAVASLKEIVERTASMGCRLGLYNHGGWAGEPESLVAICKRLHEAGHRHVGIVYNWHHGHDHINDWPEVLEQMKPWLLCLNLNGMNTGARPKILPLGQGEHDLKMLKATVASGYSGPIGILNHTDHDAELRLQDNMEGLTWLLRQLDGSPPGPVPAWRTAESTTALASPSHSNDSAVSGTFPGQLFENRPEIRKPTITVDGAAELRRQSDYNILVASDTKQSGSHWEIFTERGSGLLSVYVPGCRPDHVRTKRNVCDGRKHSFRMIMQDERIRVFVDDKLVGDEVVERLQLPVVPGKLAVGRLVEGRLGCHGDITKIRIRSGAITPADDLQNGNDSTRKKLFEWNAGASVHNHAPHDHHPDASNEVAAKVPNLPVPEFSEAFVESTLTSVMADGVAERGVSVFANARSACSSCHRIGTHGGTIGPELTRIGADRTPQQIVESVFWPRRDVKPEFSVVTILTTDGLTVRGYRQPSDADVVVLKDPTNGKVITVRRSEIEDEVAHGTLMPDGLMASMNAGQQADLLRFLISLGKPDGLDPQIVSSVLSHATSHAPATFEYDRSPLQPNDWPHWEHPVNRNRLYDFYARQADHFRKVTPAPMLLAEFPGLDGGQLGHWGNQNEDSWASDAWNQTQLGSVQCGIFRGAGATVPRAVCLRLGDHGELSACFNPDTLTYDVIWKNGFVNFSTVRHGFMHGLQMAGDRVGTNDAGEPPQNAHYRGFYRNDNRVLIAYDVNGVRYLDAPWVKDGHFERNNAPAEKHPLKHLIHGGAAQWPQRLRTEITAGAGSPYAVDNIQLPFENPWKVPVFCGDHAFLPDGSALVCTMQGDVWKVSGLVESLNSAAASGPAASATWKRFASGLSHALGLFIDDSGIYVQGRDQITRLHDLNGDDEADFYECFSNAFTTSPAGHDFICGLQRDQHGAFYTASGNQGIVRISADGRSAEVIATGFRNPDGLGLHPDGFLTIPCSEGEWTPASMICEVPSNLPAGTSPPWYGYGGPQIGKRPKLPLVYLPRGLDNSAGGQTFVDSHQWGPLQGQMLHFSFGTGSHMLLLRDVVSGRPQGAVVPLPGEFLSGAHRGRFSPVDGQLYVSGMGGWGTYTPQTGSFQRVRYTGAPVQLPTGFHVWQNGISITFSEAVSLNPSGCFAQCWNYRYSGAYGSPEYSPSHAGMRGHDVLSIRSVHPTPDPQTVFFEIPDLQPVNTLHLQLHPENGSAIDLFMTVHQLDKPYTDFPDYRPEQKIVAPHPIEADIALATIQIPNPWRRRIQNARRVKIETGKNLTYQTTEFRAVPGEPIELQLVNPDVVPHNFVLAEQGKLSAVGEAANKLVGDPEAFARHYVPQTDDVILYMDIVPPGSDSTVYFRAPKKAGQYPYLCTFPGHWMVMNGTLIVEE